MNDIYNIIDNMSNEDISMLDTMTDEDARDYFESLETDRLVEEYKQNQSF